MRRGRQDARLRRLPRGNGEVKGEATVGTNVGDGGKTINERGSIAGSEM